MDAYANVQARLESERGRISEAGSNVISWTADRDDALVSPRRTLFARVDS